MEVNFRTRGGRVRTGTIVRMNPKRARVDCGGGALFLVPYLALEPSPSAGRGGGGTIRW